MKVCKSNDVIAGTVPGNGVPVKFATGDVGTAGVIRACIESSLIINEEVSTASKSPLSNDLRVCKSQNGSYGEHHLSSIIAISWIKLVLQCWSVTIPPYVFKACAIAFDCGGYPEILTEDFNRNLWPLGGYLPSV